MSLYLSMAAFALATSISPGPVNIVALSSGARHGLAASLRHVSGATIGFTLLLLLTGFGLHELLLRWPQITSTIQWAGIGFLLFMAYKLARDNGELGAGQLPKAPSYLHGALMQWLNPKAWLASIAGMGAFVANGEALLVWQFGGIYFVICYASLAAWAYAGSCLHHYLQQRSRVRGFNRLLALLLLLCALYLF